MMNNEKLNMLKRKKADLEDALQMSTKLAMNLKFYNEPEFEELDKVIFKLWDIWKKNLKELGEAENQE